MLKAAFDACAPIDLPAHNYSNEEIMGSGRDILAEQVLLHGEPCWQTVSNMLPPLRIHAHGYLSGPAAAGGYIVKRNGEITQQGHCSQEDQKVVFSPEILDPNLGVVTPECSRLNGWMPVFVFRYKMDGRCMELLFFVSPGDPDTYPLIWMQSVWYGEEDEEVKKTGYYGFSDGYGEEPAEISQECFLDCFIMTVEYWLNRQERTCTFDIPEKDLGRTANIALADALCTFTGDHAHYGHQQYSLGVHDNFPPTYISMIETLWALGRCDDARLIAEHALAHAIDTKGRFCYRQGAQQLYGASGSDYGMWLWLIERLDAATASKDWISPHLTTLEAMGDLLGSYMAPWPGADGPRQLVMCPEADANGRFYPYLSNSLWAVRGLASLGELLHRYDCGRADIYTDLSREIGDNLMRAVRKEIHESRFGLLPPFRLGYSAVPMTLSCCRDTSVPIDDGRYALYLLPSRIRAIENCEQDYTENTYANYRYYPEMLSSMLMPRSWADAIVNLRENVGGELLGMTRFYDRLDDWPVSHYARFLLSTDRLNKYLLLLFAHAQYHGSAVFGNYYEQVGIDSRVFAPGCVPCQLLLPLMTAWMFCFEPVDENAIYLLRGIPRRWFDGESGFGASGLGSSAGLFNVRISVTSNHINVSIDFPQDLKGKTVFVDIHGSRRLGVADFEGAADRIRPTAVSNRFSFAPGLVSEKLDFRIKR